MTSRARLRRARPARFVGGLLAGSMLLAACGGDDAEPSADAVDELLDQVESTDDTDADTEVPDDEGSVEPELKGPHFHLPDEAEAPAGFTRIPAVCDSPDNDGGWITYAVPDDWDNTGRGSGSGGALSTSLELRFVRPDGGDVSIELDTESRRPDGTILDGAGEEFDGFDYEYTVDGEPTTIHFDSVSTVTAGDQDIEVFVADQAQAPDLLGSTEHAARFEAADLPNPAPGDDDKLMPASFVMTISHDSEDGELGDDVVTTIVETLAFPECTIDRAVAEQEARFGEDLDGDGDVTTAEELF